MSEQQNNFERHTQTIVQIIIAAILLWMGNSTVEMRQDIAVIKVQLAQASLAASQAQAAATQAAASAASAAAAAVMATTANKK